MATFIFPSVRRVTSGFRTKDRPTHNGVDFAETGYHEIKSVAAGKVTNSYTSSSYGECVMIAHTLNGESWESVYAHLRTGSRKVKVGQSVKQGQVIGVMGNTGRSYGQHLHFELHKGRWNIDKTDAVDPLKYLGKNLNALKDDGKLGPLTIKALQNYFGTPADGIISEPTSLVIKKLQEVLGVKADGILGPVTIKAMQKRFGTPQDGKISKPVSVVVKELQKRLNKGQL